VRIFGKNVRAMDIAINIEIFVILFVVKILAFLLQIFLLNVKMLLRV